jgi:Holliday junction resolvase
MPGRRGRRVDGNQASIVEALRASGWHVSDTSNAGDGFPDLVVAKGGRVLLLEVKDGTQRASARKLSEREIKVHAAFAAKGVTVAVIESVEDACRL